MGSAEADELDQEAVVSGPRTVPRYTDGVLPPSVFSNARDNAPMTTFVPPAPVAWMTSRDRTNPLVEEVKKQAKLIESLESRLSRFENVIKFQDIKDPNWPCGRNHHLAPVIGEYAHLVTPDEINKEYKKKYAIWAKERLSNPPRFD